MYKFFWTKLENQTILARINISLLFSCVRNATPIFPVHNNLQKKEIKKPKILVEARTEDHCDIWSNQSIRMDYTVTTHCENKTSYEICVVCMPYLAFTVLQNLF